MFLLFVNISSFLLPNLALYVCKLSSWCPNPCAFRPTKTYKFMNVMFCVLYKFCAALQSIYFHHSQPLQATFSIKESILSVICVPSLSGHYSVFILHSSVPHFHVSTSSLLLPFPFRTYSVSSSSYFFACIVAKSRTCR